MCYQIWNSLQVVDRGLRYPLLAQTPTAMTTSTSWATVTGLSAGDRSTQAEPLQQQHSLTVTQQQLTLDPT